MAAAQDIGTMNPEELKELKELIGFLKENKIGEFDLERGELKVRIKFAQDAPAAQASSLDLAGLNRLLTATPPPVPAIHAAAAAPASAEPPIPASEQAGEDVGLHFVKSPIV